MNTLTLITVNRQPSTADWTLSSFISNDGSISGVGVEDEKRQVKVKGETRIPAGTYNLSLVHSPKFTPEYYRDDEGFLLDAKTWNTSPIEVQQRFHTQHEVLSVDNVPGFADIRWHWGNTDLDTDGCYVVGSVFGKTKGRDGVLNSRKKYTEIYPVIWRAMKAGNKVQVQYIDHEG